MTDEERVYYARQHCDTCQRATDWYRYFGSKPICGACWERFWCAFVAIPVPQREALKGLRARIKAGSVTEWPEIEVDGRWQSCA